MVPRFVNVETWRSVLEAMRQGHISSCLFVVIERVGSDCGKIHYIKRGFFSCSHPNRQPLSKKIRVQKTLEMAYGETILELSRRAVLDSILNGEDKSPICRKTVRWRWLTVPNEACFLVPGRTTCVKREIFKNYIQQGLFGFTSGRTSVYRG